MNVGYFFYGFGIAGLSSMLTRIMMIDNIGIASTVSLWVFAIMIGIGAGMIENNI